MLRRGFANLFQNRNQTWTFYAQMARLISGFAFIGLLARTLPSEMLGTWYIFVSLFGVASLVEMGLGQVIGRHAAYLKADYDLGRISCADFLKFAKVGERIYLFLAITIGVIVIPAGLWWLGYRRAEWDISVTLGLAWLVYVGGGMSTIIGTYYAALLNGAGQMWQTQRAAIFAAGVSVAVLLFLLLFPAMLLIPAIAMLLSQLLVVVLVRRALFKLDITRAAILFNGTDLIDTAGTLRNIAKDAAKMFVIMVSYQLLTNGFVLVLSKYLSQQEIGSYGLTMQLIGVVMSLSMIWSQSNFFEMAATRQSGDTAVLRKIFLSGLVRALGVAFLGMVGVFLFASSFLVLLGSKTGLLQPLLLAVVSGSALLEFSLTQFSQLLIARGDMRVAYLSLLVAITVCGVAVFLLSAGYTLTTVFMARIIIFSSVIGIPVLIVSYQLLHALPSSIEANHEAA